MLPNIVQWECQLIRLLIVSDLNRKLLGITGKELFRCGRSCSEMDSFYSLL